MIINSTEKRKFIYFLLIGLLSFCIDLTVYYCLFKLGLDLLIAKAIGFFCGSLNSYYVNKIFNFKYDGNTRKSFLIHCVVYTSSLAINSSLNYYLFSFVLMDFEDSMRFNIAVLCATAFSTIWNFVGMKLFTFSDRSQ